MGKVLLDQFKAKLAKKIKNNQDLGKLQIKIDLNDVANKRNQIFISCLSEYLSVIFIIFHIIFYERRDSNSHTIGTGT